MDELRKNLRASLLENPAVQVMEERVWHLPVVTVDVVFKRVKRSKMDILLKMLLFAFEQTDIRRAAHLSEMLLVEELFIEDSIQKMKRAGLIRLEQAGYRLTAKGQEQLAAGIFEEEMEEEQTVLIYSPVHDAFWPEMAGPVSEIEEERELYRYATDQKFIDTNRILEVLSERENTLEEDGLQTVVSEVKSFSVQMTEHILCLEFQMYHTEQDMFYARVWNTGLERWDGTLEQQIEEQERGSWREGLEI